MDSRTSLDEAADAVQRILSFYETIPASDPKAFSAGLVEMLSMYDRHLVERATSAIHGIPAHFNRWNLNLADVKKLLDGWRADELRRADLERRFLPKPAAPEPDPEMRARVARQFRDLSDQLKAGIGPSQI